MESWVNHTLFRIDVEGLIVKCALNTAKSMPACPRNNLTYLTMVIDITDFRK